MKLSGKSRPIVAASAAGPEGLSYQCIEGLSQVYGDAFYLFDQDGFRDNFVALNAAFRERYARTQVAYSYKTNYTPHICRIVDELGGYAEVVSEMEYKAARRLNVDCNRIIYNGPYKSIDSLRDALCSGAIVNMDSMRDFDIVSAVAEADPARTFSIGIRCNFDMPGISRSRFGIDVQGDEFREIIQSIAAVGNVELAGLHCHFPCRDLDSFAIRAQRMVAIAREVFDGPPQFLNLGGGFCGPMPKSLAGKQTFTPPTFEQYARAVGEIISGEYQNGVHAPLLFIESGTALVADTLKFYAKVISLKQIGDRNVATVAGSIFNISPHARTPHLPIRVIPQQGAGRMSTAKTSFDIAGYSCIEGDYLSREVKVPITVGDFVEYGNLGSYSIVMKPPFILPNVPVLTALRAGAEPVVIKRAETIDDIFRTFS